MKTALLYEEHDLKTFALVLESGDEAMHALESWAAENRVRASQFTAIGAFQRATVAYFDWSTKEYKPISIDEQVEVLAMNGDITLDQQRPKVHAHVVLGKSDATAHGGHLLKGFVRPTLEIIVTELPRHLYRHHDAASGLALIDPFAKR
jgi:predicted DNA-binding protein with PD1-like motif